MKKIRIWFCDFWPLFEIEDNFIIKILEKNYEVEINKNNPDYVFYSNFGYEHLKYKGIKVFYTAENVFPNFNICDYAIGPHDIALENRYFRLPIFLIKYNHFRELPQRKEVTHSDLKNKNKFCNFVYNNKKGNNFRKEFFEELSKYKKVDSAGEFLNNTGYVTKNKLKMQEKYKFTIAFENEEYNDYSTEKIMDAFISNTIPIYWGDQRIDKYINPKAFIDCSKYKDKKSIIKKIKEIDENDKKWLEIANEPIFIKEDYENRIKKDLEKFLNRVINDSTKQTPMSLEAKRQEKIIKQGSRLINLKHKIHRLKVEKWK